MKFVTNAVVLTISSGDKIPNCTRLTVRNGAFESLIAIFAEYFAIYCLKKYTKIHLDGRLPPVKWRNNTANFICQSSKLSSVE